MTRHKDSKNRNSRLEIGPIPDESAKMCRVLSIVRCSSFQTKFQYTTNFMSRAELEFKFYILTLISVNFASVLYYS